MPKGCLGVAGPQALILCDVAQIYSYASETTDGTVSRKTATTGSTRSPPSFRVSGHPPFAVVFPDVIEVGQQLNPIEEDV